MPLFPGDKPGAQRPPAVPGALFEPEPLPSLVKSPEERLRERMRRQRELLFAGIAFVVVLVLIMVQLYGFSSGTVIFIAMFNLNAILLVAVLFVVLRNGMKLLLERRRRMMGSRLRTRLVLAITAMTLVPCLLMFLVTAQFVKLSVDFWFKNQVETSMESAMEVTRSFYEKAGQRLRGQAENVLLDLVEQKVPLDSQSADLQMERKRKEYRLALIGYLDAALREKNWRALGATSDSWQIVREKLDWNAVKTRGYEFTLGSGAGGDVLYGVLAVEGGAGGYLVLGEDMGPDFQGKIDRVVSGAGEYKQLRSLKAPLKSMLYITLAVLTALITLGTIWFAFRVSRELISPIMVLVAATERVAKGDPNVRLEDTSSDELGVLVRSFNRMAADIGQSRQELTDANAMLAQQNLVLDQHRRYVETVLDNIAAGVVSFDANWQVTTANKAACEILSRSPVEMLGRHIQELIPEHLLKQAKDTGRRLLRHPDLHFQQQLTIKKHHEDRRLLVTAVGLPSQDGSLQGSVFVFEDITEMEKMQRTAAWREVARRIAHEIKNPLTPIKLSAQRLERKFAGGVPDPVFRQSTQLIVHQVEQLQAMVQEFSSFAKLPEVHPQRGDLPPLLEEATALFRVSHSRIRWELKIASHLPQVEMDAAALQRAFFNIFTNAVEALEKTPNPAVFVTASYVASLNLVRVDVEDNGPGLSEEERLRLFEPYFSRKKGGTGLGLTIVRSILADHRGYVRASLGELGGTVITVELPLA